MLINRPNYAISPEHDSSAVALERGIAGIDIAGLNAEMDAERAEQEAEADAVLAEVTGQMAPAVLPVTAATAPPQAIIAGSVGPGAATRRARNGYRRKKSFRRFALPAAVVALIAGNAALITWRSDIVRLLPQTAALYSAAGLAVNLRGLALQDVRMSRAEQNGANVLVVEGDMVNVTRRAVEVPRLRLAMRNDGKNEVYAWTAQPARSILGPGETLSFRSRIASPPPDAREVEVRFFSERDLDAGLN